MKPADRAAKDRLVEAGGARAWTWSLDEPMPGLPDVLPRRS
jgi:CO dehydrogenase/acetyl-CoA synthase delta subunit